SSCLARSRLLHSFPTRRSSDLGALSIAWDALTDPVVGYLSDHAESPRFGRRHLFILAGGLGIALFNYTLWTISPASSLGLRVGLDRKSTRLNSSHSQISYAVFC